MEALSAMTVNFAFILALALLIERSLEIVKAVLNLLDSTRDWHKSWTRRAHWMKGLLEQRLRANEYVTPAEGAVALRRFSEILLNKQGTYAGTLPVISGDLLRSLAFKVGMKAAGVCLGIGAAFYFELDMLRQWGEIGYFDLNAPLVLERFLARNDLHYALTGIAAGLGSAPMHKVIVALESRKAKREGATS